MLAALDLSRILGSRDRFYGISPREVHRRNQGSGFWQTQSGNLPRVLLPRPKS